MAPSDPFIPSFRNRLLMALPAKSLSEWWPPRGLDLNKDDNVRRTMTVIEDVAQHEAILRQAILANDIIQLERLLSDDLRFTDQTGRVLTKSDDLDLHRSGKLKIVRMDYLDQYILEQYDGNNVDVYTKVLIEGSFDKDVFNGISYYTRRWKQIDRGWKVMTGSCTSIVDDIQHTISHRCE